MSSSLVSPSLYLFSHRMNIRIFLNSYAIQEDSASATPIHTVLTGRKDSMCSTYDLTYNDLNPTLFFTGKRQISETKQNHCHDTVELQYVLSGSQQFSVDGKIYDVTAGDLIILNPGVMHYSIVTSTDEPAILFFTGFSNFHFRGMEPNYFTPIVNEPVIHTKGQFKQDVLNLCLRMIAERHNSQAGQYFMQKTYLVQLLILIMRQVHSMPEHEQNSFQFETYHKTYVVSEIQQYLGEHYSDKISLDLIAKNMYLSSAYISKIFKEETGEAPINYLIKLRLEHAKDQLELPQSYSIKSISNSVGYEDVYYFSKLFKKYYGMSPQIYRANFRKTQKH